MKKIAKILSMILALIFVVSAFAACQTPDDPAKESGNNQGSETDPVIETDPPKDPLQLTEGDTCKYTIVRPMNAGDAIKNASVNIKNALSEAIGGNAVSISEDFLASNMKPGEFEILVGNTNREESAKAIEGFKYFDYAIVIEGSKLVINGRDEAMVAEAVKHFISMIEAAEGDIIFNDGDQLVVKQDYPFEELKFGDTVINDYAIVLPSAATPVMKAYANSLQLKIAQLCGSLLPVINDRKEETDKEILLGNTSREASKAVDAAALGEYGYSISASGSKIVVKANDDIFSFIKTVDAIMTSLESGSFAASTGKITIKTEPVLTSFCFTDVHNNFAMLEPTNNTGDYVVRKNVNPMIDLILETEGAVDLVMVGGDLMSDYPHWNASGNWPYKYFVEYRALLVQTFARLSKDGKVIYCGGNHDYGQGENATDCPHTEKGNYNSTDFYFGDVGMRQSMGELAEEDMFWKIGEHTGDKYLICYYYKVNGVHVLGLAPDPDIIWSKQGDGFSEESLQWLSAKLDEIDPYGTEVIFINCHYPLDNTYEQEDGSLTISNNGYNSQKLTPVYAGHRNLFHFFGHWESWYHDYSSKAVIHYNSAKKPVVIEGNETDSTQVISFSQRSFNAVNMGHFRPMYNDSPDMFEKDYVIGDAGFGGNRYTHGSTCTPKCGQGMYVAVYEDRIEFTMKNIGDYEGLTTDDILETYTVWLYK